MSHGFFVRPNIHRLDAHPAGAGGGIVRKIILTIILAITLGMTTAQPMRVAGVTEYITTHEMTEFPCPACGEMALQVSITKIRCASCGKLYERNSPVRIIWRVIK